MCRRCRKVLLSQGLGGSRTPADDNYLCDICRQIDFKFLVNNHFSPKNAIKLGLLRDIVTKDECAFCRMVVIAMSITYKVDILQNLESEAKDTFCELMDEEKRAGSGDKVYTLDLMIYNDYGTIDSGDDSAMIHVLGDEKSPRPNEGRLVSKNQLELSQLKKWLHTCEHVHPSGDTDEANFLGSRDLFLRVIDVQRQCIVRAPQECRYMALSYVWGGPQELQYTKATQPELERPNGLSIDDKRLPRTIKDAMLLISRFDERYLWVDSLYIMQDDTENKHSQITLVDVIYQSAILTLVAVSGKSANPGLPGHVICLLSVFNREGRLAGTVHVPGPIASNLSKGSHEFILLSRTRLDRENLYDEDPLKIDKKRFANLFREHAPFEVQDDAPSDLWGPKYAFDHTRYDAEKFFCVYNVMLVEWEEGVAYRLGLGWVHIDAFHQTFPEKKLITLG
ncbi:hypothetical protein MMC29_003493 [Sticta canariensis]|nr:hypothetical protein [Sticta canariensis]